MKMTDKEFTRKLFGVNSEKLKRSLFICLVVFWGLHIADLRVRIAPPFLYLAAGAFTAGVMWQALSAEDHAAEMKNRFMLPFSDRKFIVSYVGALGVYTLFTKTVLLLAVLLAVSVQRPAAIAGSILCAINGVLTPAAVFSRKNRRYVGGPLALACAAAILFLGNHSWFFLLPAAGSAISAALLLRADGYSFYQEEREHRHVVKRHVRHSVFRYFLRYMNSHKNYMTNTLILWGVACVLPFLFREMDGMSFVPVGFAILSLNTPVCILLSSDPALRQAVRFLPGQGRAFCAPYCLFIFFSNLAADLIFLGSLEIQNGGVTAPMIAAACLFALTGAVCSVLLEWFCPIRNAPIESDLWHHPRKYVVPAILLLLAGSIEFFAFFQIL